VPVVLGLAALTFIGWLVVGPDPRFNLCAPGEYRRADYCLPPAPWAWPHQRRSWLVLARPAEHGILIRGGEALEQASQNQHTIILDKTGTPPPVARLPSPILWLPRV